VPNQRVGLSYSTSHGPTLYQLSYSHHSFVVYHDISQPKTRDRGDSVARPFPLFAI